MRLSTAAWLACATHVLAALGSFFLLRPGTPAEPDIAARAAYIDAHLLAWRIGWALWIVATVALFLLLRTMDRRAALVVLPGLAVDLASQLVLAIPLPWSQLAYRGSGVVANGLYTLALFLALRGVELPRRLRAGGMIVVALGAAVALASIPLHPTALVVATGALTVAMIGWTAALGVWAWRRSS